MSRLEEDVRKEELERQYDLGKRCAMFWGSEVGQYLQKRCDAYERQVMEEFSRADVKDEANILRLQSFLQVPKLFREWVTRAMEEGEMAEFQLQEEVDI